MNILEDPVAAEVRQVRRELSERFGDDINALCDFLAAMEAQHPERLVNYPPEPAHLVAVKDPDPSKE
jgi:hypothetical protein